MRAKTASDLNMNVPHRYRVVTVATQSYEHHTRELSVSLRKVWPESELTIYCDSEDTFRAYGRAIYLPEISSIGVYRARFAVYANAIREGSFLYLDSDIVVLEELSSLTGFDRLAACPDDLSGCDFIADRRCPWPGNPTLENRKYVNAGVIWFPESVAPFLDDIYLKATDDEEWLKHIIPDRLRDNHFLCAQLNLSDQPIHLLDEGTGNWQALRRDGAVRSGNHLYNARTGELILLAHFAGIADVDSYLCSLPVDVSSLLCERAGRTMDSPERAVTFLLGSAKSRFNSGDTFVSTVATALVHEVLALDARQDFSREDSYFRDSESILSLAYSKPNSDVLWNELSCGGAYLEGDEYNYLQAVVKETSTRTVVELGAGKTSLLFHRLGIDALAIECTKGPWLSEALEAGCRCELVRFDSDSLLFESRDLVRALRSVNRSPDLLFVDAPNGRLNRSRIVDQLLRLMEPKYLLLHDAHRDSSNVFSIQKSHGLSLADYFPSRRGMVLLGPSIQIQSRVVECWIENPDVAVSSDSAPSTMSIDQSTDVRILVMNNGPEPLSSRYEHPVHVAYHWFDVDGNCVEWDGLRSPLPFDIQPGGNARFRVSVIAPARRGSYRCEIALVQEGNRWLCQGSQSLTFDVIVS